MKKILSIALAALLALTVLASCGKSESGTVSTDGSTSMQKVIGALGEPFTELTTAASPLLTTPPAPARASRQFPRGAATSVFPAAR